MVKMQLEQVSVTLGKRAVLRDVSATFVAGEFVGIVGPNGAGKSTLARAMLGLLPSDGHILLDGCDVLTLPRNAIARRIAYLPQGQTLHWPLTVERLVGLGRLPHLAPMSRISEQDAAVIARVMARSDVGHLHNRIATELSGGERARVLLARALAVEAAALVADEPLANLDPGHQIDVMDVLQQQVDSGGLVITVLHDLTMAARYCSRLILIDDGAVIADGAPVEVLTPDNLHTVYGIKARIELGGSWPTITVLGRSADE